MGLRYMRIYSLVLVEAVGGWYHGKSLKKIRRLRKGKIWEVSTFKAAWLVISYGLRRCLFRCLDMSSG
jgi:hypothetical protein